MGTSDTVGDDDSVVERLLLSRGVCSKTEIDAARAQQETLRLSGATSVPSIGTLLIQRGSVSEEAMSKIIDLAPDLPVEVIDSARDPRKVFGQYIRTERLGIGAMGEVWKAWDRELQRWVALKFLRHGSNADLARFKREAHIAGQLTHANIASVYGYGEQHQQPYIAMQYIEGRTLAEFPRTDIRLLVEIIRDVALAVHHAHERGIVHRDLKPANIMIEELTQSRLAQSSRRPSDRQRTSRYRVYVMDFGLAKLTAVDSSLSRSGTAIGTPMYMPPEQALGESERIGPASDVYSLGATAYDLLAKRPPFVCDDVYALLLMVVDKNPKPLRKRNSRIDPDLDTVVLKCLEKDPARRYVSALDLADDLSRWLNGEAIHAHAPSAFYQFRKYLLQHKAASIAAVAILLLAFLAVADQLRRANQRAELAEHLQRATQDYADQQYQKAVEHYSRALELDRENAEIRARLSECQQRLEQSAGAERRREAAQPAYLRGMAELEECWKDLYRQGADLVRMRQRLAGAVTLFSQSLNEWPDNPEAFFARGRALALRFEVDPAQNDFSRALELRPSFTAARTERGKLSLQRYIEAEMHMGWCWNDEVAKPFASWLEQAKTDFSDQAVLEFIADHFGPCQKLCEAHLAEKREQEEVWKLLGDTYLMGGPKGPEQTGTADQLAKLEKSIECYDEALRLRPNYYEARMMRGDAFRRRGKAGDNQRALDDIAVARKLRPDDPLSCWYAANALEKPEEALKGMDEGLKLKADSFVLHTGRVRALYQLQRFDEANKELEVCLHLNPAHYYGWYQRGCLRSSSGDDQGAYADFQKTLTIVPDFYSAWFNLGAVAYNTGRYAEAASAMRKALALGHPDQEAVRKIIQMAEDGAKK